LAKRLRVPLSRSEDRFTVGSLCIRGLSVRTHDTNGGAQSPSLHATHNPHRLTANLSTHVHSVLVVRVVREEARPVRVIRRITQEGLEGSILATVLSLIDALVRVCHVAS